MRILSGYITDFVYNTPVVDLEDLCQRIVAACAIVVLQEVHTQKFINGHPMEVPLLFAANGIFIHQLLGEL